MTGALAASQTVSNPNGLVLLGWKTRDRALALLQQECEFDPPLSDTEAERVWAEYREHVNALQGRDVLGAVHLQLTDEERRLVDRFLADVSKHGGPMREVIKIDPLGLVVHQLEITTARSMSMSERLQTAEQWAAECLCPTGSSLRPSVRSVPNSIDIDLPHGEWALLFDPQLGLILGEAARCITVSVIKRHLVLWSGYHRTYAAATRRAAGERTILAGVVEDVKVPPGVKWCGLRAVESDIPPIFADFLDPRLTLPVRFRAKRFTMEVRARVVGVNVDEVAPEVEDRKSGLGALENGRGWNVDARNEHVH